MEGRIVCPEDSAVEVGVFLAFLFYCAVMRISDDFDGERVLPFFY